MIKDSGARTEFETGAVRDMKEGKGRCDLMPLDVVCNVLEASEYVDDSACEVLKNIYKFQVDADCDHLYESLMTFFMLSDYTNMIDMILDVSQHFEEGAKKYGEYNWQKGIPESSYIDSAVRHYLKWLRGDSDELHDRAFIWNVLCLIWTDLHVTNISPERSTV